MLPRPGEIAVGVVWVAPDADMVGRADLVLERGTVWIERSVAADIVGAGRIEANHDVGISVPMKCAPSGPSSEAMSPVKA